MVAPKVERAPAPGVRALGGRPTRSVTARTEPGGFDAGAEGELWGVLTSLRPHRELVVDGAMGMPGPPDGDTLAAVARCAQEQS